MNRFGILTLFLGGLLFVSACEDYPQMVEYPVPQPTSAIGKALVEGTDQISVIYKDSTYTLHKGVEVTEMAYLSSEGRSIRTFWYKIDLSEPTINLECVTPYGTHTVGGNPEVLSKMLSHVDKEGNCVLGGTNTDFGGGLGPQGVYWSNGVVLKDKFTFLQDRPRCFVYIKDKTMGIGYESEYNRILADCGGSFDQAFCGSPRLIVDGKIDIDVPNDLDEASHPRTAIGIMPDRKTIYLMVVDGR
ncbi:MAG: phosphodiester glycosidase family protein, partial [Bacteroidales bacterium]|nr:phosphodiester glycosidase family protein [Bacteroidales bacterium]